MSTNDFVDMLFCFHLIIEMENSALRVHKHGFSLLSISIFTFGRNKKR
jgi:hypothetical protein